ncbi:MAG: ABC transporter substrate-binding protein [Burkholderiaceae bacterium]
MKRRTFTAALGAAPLLALNPLRAFSANDKPAVIRISFPNAGTGGRPLGGGSYPANSHHLRAIDEEFKADGIRIEWKFFPGAGPALNESFANGLTDFAFGHGDLPTIVGRSTGLKHKVLMSAGRGGDSYFVVPSGSSAKSLIDLKGKRLATFKGTAQQLTLYRWLDKFGLTEKDFRIISLDSDSTLAALSTGDIDGAVRAPFDLEARGVARRIHEIVNDPALTAPSTLWVGEEFEKKYPEIVQRVVTRLIKVAHWSTQQANREKQYQLWSTSGTPYIDYKTEWDHTADLRFRINPLLDEYYVARIQRSIDEVKKYKLSRREVTMDGWLEPKYLNNALKELKLEDYWPQQDANGKVKYPGRKLT